MGPSYVGAALNSQQPFSEAMKQTFSLPPVTLLTSGTYGLLRFWLPRSGLPSTYWVHISGITCCVIPSRYYTSLLFYLMVIFGLLVFYLFGRSVSFSVIQFSIYSVLRIRSTVPARSRSGITGPLPCIFILTLSVTRLGDFSPIGRIFITFGDHFFV